MKVLVQTELKDLVQSPNVEIYSIGEMDISAIESHQFAVAVGDQNFFSSLIGSSIKYKILLCDDNEVHLQVMKSIQPTYIFKTHDIQSISRQLSAIEETLSQNNKASQISKEIQKKRKELEVLNEQLISESQIQFSTLEKSNSEEILKNANEKSLLYFLDFISSESLNDDFVSQILKLIWKELKKMGYAYQIGFCFENLNQTVSLISYGAMGERSDIIKLVMNSEFDSTWISMAMGRPIGKIMHWKLTEFSRNGYFFVESIDQQFLSHQVEAYFKERLFTLSLYFDRWLIEKEYHLLIERWDQTFQSFSGFTHVIDENYVIHQSNYLKKPHAESYCYQVLAERTSPCLECPIQTKSTAEFFLKDQRKVRASVSEFSHIGKKFYFMFYEDMTNLNLLKSKMIQSEKMATVGRLGNHLSHELNNPLTGLKLYTQLLLGAEKEDVLTPSLKSDLTEILKATDRCEKIIKNLLQFSQQTEIALASVSFADVLDSTLTLLKTALRPHRMFIDLKKTNVCADFTALQQVLFNVLKNACQAMETPGSIKIFEMETETEIIFCIQDSGPGLQGSMKKNLFAPFMTTKKVGEGTGLGLYLSKKLMQRMNGDMMINSNYKSGLQIDLVLKKS